MSGQTGWYGRAECVAALQIKHFRRKRDSVEHTGLIIQCFGKLHTAGMHSYAINSSADAERRAGIDQVVTLRGLYFFKQEMVFLTVNIKDKRVVGEGTVIELEIDAAVLAF